MTTTNKITDRQLEVWIDDANSVLNDGGATVDETSAASTILALCEALQASRKADSAELVLYAAEETLAYAKMGEPHLTCLSQPMGDAVIPLYTAPPAPIVVDEEALKTQIKLTWWGCGETNIMSDETASRIVSICRAAIFQGKAERESLSYMLPPNSFTDEDLEMMAYGDNPQSNAYRELLEFRRNSPATPDCSFSGLFNSARALLDALYEFGGDEVAISEYVTNLEDALRVAAAPLPEVK